jgi:hypothetical protein
MPDEVEALLRLVAEGRLTPEEAAPILEALEERRAAANTAGPPATRPGRQLRVRITEHGRQVVNLRIPLAFAPMAARMVPGLSGEQADRIRAALDAGVVGPIVDVEDEDGSGVLIGIE